MGGGPESQELDVGRRVTARWYESKNAGSLQKLENVRRCILPGASSCAHTMSLASLKSTVVSTLWNCKIIRVLLLASKHVIICYSSKKKLIHNPNARNTADLLPPVGKLLSPPRVGQSNSSPGTGLPWRLSLDLETSTSSLRTQRPPGGGTQRPAATTTKSTKHLEGAGL